MKQAEKVCPNVCKRTVYPPKGVVKPKVDEKIPDERAKRNQQIVEKWQSGGTLVAVASEFGLTKSGVWHLIQGKNRLKKGNSQNSSGSGTAHCHTFPHASGVEPTVSGMHMNDDYDSSSR